MTKRRPSASIRAWAVLTPTTREPEGELGQVLTTDGRWVYPVFITRREAKEWTQGKGRRRLVRATIQIEEKKR